MSREEQVGSSISTEASPTKDEPDLDIVLCSCVLAMNGDGTTSCSQPSICEPQQLVIKGAKEAAPPNIKDGQLVNPVKRRTDG